MIDEIKCLQDLQSTCENLLINAEIELNIDNSKVVERIIEYKRMREQLDDLIFDMSDQYRTEIDAYIEQNQSKTVA